MTSDVSISEPPPLRRPPQPHSRTPRAYTILILSALGVGVTMISALTLLDLNADQETNCLAIGLSLFGICWVLAHILLLVWLFHSWSYLPSSLRPHASGTIVGRLFIPFFRLYWGFRAYAEFSKCLDTALYRLDPKSNIRAGYELSIALAITHSIPIVNFFVFPIIAVPWLWKVNNGRNQLIRAQWPQ